MTDLQLLAAITAVVGALFLVALVVCVLSSCMLSSTISRRERIREQNLGALRVLDGMEADPSDVPEGWQPTRIGYTDRATGKIYWEVEND